MGTECVNACFSGSSAVNPAVPPGFETVLPLATERIQNNTVTACISPSHSSNSQQKQVDNECQRSAENSRKSLRNRRSINYSQFDNSSDDELGPELFEHEIRSVNSAKKGVIRGCPNCANCQKVLSTWRPEDARRPILDEAPAFYPNEEEFKDTLNYIESIRSRVEPYGICRIVPPPSWNPPCPLKEKVVWDNSKFATRVQRIDLLQNRKSFRKMSGSQIMTKRRRLLEKDSDPGNSNENSVKTGNPCQRSNAENFGFEPGLDFTLESFQRYADDFKRQYFCAKHGSSNKNVNPLHPQNHWEPSEEDIEGEYWRVVEKPTEEIEVLYGADLETGEFGSGFPKAASTSSSCNEEQDEYVKSGWNLNRFPRIPGSVLAFESEDISGVLVPWLYIGMCFSSFCWHVEDHHLYSLNYMHWGAPKMWYGVSGTEASQLEAAMRKHLPDLFEEQPDLLHNLVTQFSPTILKSEGVPVYRCVQHSGEFVLTFPRAYHSGFNCGFNCAEAVNVAPIDWLPHGQNAVELYRNEGRKISVSHDKLLLGAAREAVKAQWDISFLKKTRSDGLLWKKATGQDKILVKALKARVEMERARREHFSSSQSTKMDASFDASGDRECFICHYDLHLSAAGCSCSSDKLACLDHAKQMCLCDWSKRFLLFRYEITELNTLIDALGGKLSAVHKWGVSDLGLSLRAYVTKHKSQGQAVVSETSSEVKQQEKITEGLSSHLPSSNEEMFDQKGKQQIAVSGKEFDMTCGGLQENDMGLQFGKGCSSSGSELLNAGSQLSKAGISYGTCKEPDSRGQPTTRDACLLPINSEPKENHNLMDKEQGDLDKKTQKVFTRVTCHEGVTAPSDCKDQLPKTSAAMMSETNSYLLPVMESSHPKVKEEEAYEISRENTYVSNGNLCRGISTRSYNMGIARTVVKPVLEFAASKLVNGYDSYNNGSDFHSSHVHGSLTQTDVHRGGTAVLDSLAMRAERFRSVTGSQPCLLNIIDRQNLQKGPRMAKVVRRLNCNVETLEFGEILTGWSWSTSQAIFPKGYRSRVKYFSILDPAQMCYYVSEILDGGRHGPLFMVQVEQCPSEVFMHVTVTKCWDMVRERVNHEIRRSHSFGNYGVPTLQPPGSVDGLEMFGLTSPLTIQAIEAIDRNHVSLEYWRSRTQNQGSPIPCGDLRPGVKEEPDIHDASNLSVSTRLLQGLLKKADFEEMQLLHQLLTNATLRSNQEIIQSLKEAIEISKPNVSDCT